VRRVTFCLRFRVGVFRSDLLAPQLSDGDQFPTSQGLNTSTHLFSVWEIKLLDERVAILQTINDKTCCVSDLIRELRVRSEKIVSLLRAMEKEGLVDFPKNNNCARNNLTLKGRPKKIAVMTPLGQKLLEEYVKCERNIIQINDNDIQSSIHQVALRKSLEERNISIYERFLELNEVVYSIKNSVAH
jgi:DNA-binding MarR family transcriptional regulator